MILFRGPERLMIFFIQSFSLAGAIRIARVEPKSTDASAFNYRHNGYIDQRVREDPRNMLNHERWYLRNVLMSPPITPALFENSSVASTISIDTPTASLQDTRIPSTSIPKPLPAQALKMTDNLDEHDNTTTWSQETDVACLEALSAMNGVASNPSGMAVCYNVQSFNNLTGSFRADLRIYQLSAPTEDWVQTSEKNVRLGLHYLHASVTHQSTSERKRDESAQRPSWSKEEAHDVLLTRSNRSPPRKFEGLTLEGKLRIGQLDGLQDNTSIRVLFSPEIDLSATKQDGSRVQTALSVQDASYVNGLFTNGPQTYEASNATTSDESTDFAVFRSSAKKLNTIPIGLIITSGWALLLMFTTGCGIVIRTKARNTYKRELKKGWSGGPSVISWH